MGTYSVVTRPSTGVLCFVMLQWLTLSHLLLLLPSSTFLATSINYQGETPVDDDWLIGMDDIGKDSEDYLTKRSPYEFGIGKRSPYEFGIGKRSPFGFPKRSWDFDWGQYSKRKPYNF